MFIINNFSVKKKHFHIIHVLKLTLQRPKCRLVTHSVITQTAEPNLLLHLGKMTQNAMFSYGR